MSRLIDADEVKSHFDDSGTYAWVIKDIIDKSPTVDAIPMSVLEDIKAEIQMVMDLYKGCEYIGDKARCDELGHVLEIIDRHMSRKEKE